jgi:hypothetical protein
VFQVLSTIVATGAAVEACSYGQDSNCGVAVTIAVCLASSSWQGFFDFEVGDGGVRESGVDVGWPVPSDGFVGADVVVVGPVGIDLLDELESVVDLFPEQPLVFHRSEAAFA